MDTTIGGKNHLNVYLAVSYMFNCYHISRTWGALGRWLILISCYILPITRMFVLLHYHVWKKLERENYLFLRYWFFPTSKAPPPLFCNIYVPSFQRSYQVWTSIDCSLPSCLLVHLSSQLLQELFLNLQNSHEDTYPVSFFEYWLLDLNR